jgi:integrase
VREASRVAQLSVRSKPRRRAEREPGRPAVGALEEPDDINHFKTESNFAEEVEIATVHRALEALRAAMNWGMAQTPPLFKKSPFHRFGVRMDKKLETTRDRRLTREEEKRPLDAALTRMNTAEHQFAGSLLHDRIIGAIELCCRRGEMLLIQNKRVNWETYQIGIPGATAKDKENRRIPFNPQGRLRAILERRAKLGPDAYVFGSATGAYQPELQTAWETLRLLAHGIEPRPTRKGAAWNREQLQQIDLRWHDLRHEGACRLLADGVDIRIIQLMLGHASIQQTQRYLNVTDEELRRGLEVSWNYKGRPLRLASGA